MLPEQRAAPQKVGDEGGFKSPSLSDLSVQNQTLPLCKLSLAKASRLAAMPQLFLEEWKLSKSAKQFLRLEFCQMQLTQESSEKTLLTVLMLDPRSYIGEMVSTEDWSRFIWGIPYPVKGQSLESSWNDLVWRKEASLLILYILGNNMCWSWPCSWSVFETNPCIGAGGWSLCPRARFLLSGQGSGTCDLLRLFGEDCHPHIIVSKPNERVVLCVFCSDELIWCSLW